MNYPQVLDELATIERAHAGENMARYGDGELKLALGGKCVSQPFDPALQKELIAILKKPADGCLPCIPNVDSKTPKQASWLNWARPPYLDLYDMKRTYGSSFVTRPDSAPWIDTEAYWSRIKDFWRGQHVALVAGTQRSLRPDMMTEAASVTFIDAPSGQKGDGAYAKVNQLMEALWGFTTPIILCVGPTATVLANRLAARGQRTQDLGHVGLFMRSAGAYRYRLDDLISPNYRRLLIEKHAKSKWGTDGKYEADAVLAYADELEAETILDYGAGRGTLANALKGRRRVSEYDPGVSGKEGMPKPCDLVVCSDVLEHIEPEKLNDVLGHIKSISLKGCYFVISTRPASTLLPDGRNAHLCVRPAKWWLRGLANAGFVVKQFVEQKDQVTVWAKR